MYMCVDCCKSVCVCVYAHVCVQCTCSAHIPVCTASQVLRLERERKGFCPLELQKLKKEQRVGPCMKAISCTAMAMTLQRGSTPKLHHTATLASSLAAVGLCRKHLHLFTLLLSH